MAAGREVNEQNNFLVVVHWRFLACCLSWIDIDVTNQETGKEVRGIQSQSTNGRSIDRSGEKRSTIENRHETERFGSPQEKKPDVTLATCEKSRDGNRGSLTSVCQPVRQLHVIHLRLSKVDTLEGWVSNTTVIWEIYCQDLIFSSSRHVRILETQMQGVWGKNLISKFWEDSFRFLAFWIFGILSFKISTFANAFLTVFNYWVGIKVISFFFHDFQSKFINTNNKHQSIMYWRYCSMIFFHISVSFIIPL